jgi:periplasmic protein TonB
MKTRFLVPAAVALALHAVFLFGFRSHPASRVTGAPPAPPFTPTDWVELLPPPEPPKGDETATKGRPADPRTDLPDPPTPDKIAAIPIPARDPVKFSPQPTTVPGPIGDPDAGDWTAGRQIGPVNPRLLDNSPHATVQVAPVYPYEARISGQPGDVLVEFVVDESGRVRDPHVLRSSDPRFEAPTLRAVAKWRFEPGRRHGQVVSFRMAVPVAFAVTP